MKRVFLAFWALGVISGIPIGLFLFGEGCRANAQPTFEGVERYYDERTTNA